MKNIKRVKPRTFLMAAFLLAILFSLVSCEEDVPYSDLDVYISGTLSGNPREDILVTLYYSEADAEFQTNPVTYSEYTDYDGYAYFFDLDIGVRYWVRSDVVFTYIKQTRALKPGSNTFRFTVL